jgi:hypothetical protein
MNNKERRKQAVSRYENDESPILKTPIDLSKIEALEFTMFIYFKTLT